MVTQYSTFSVKDIKAQTIKDWDTSDAKYIRVELPACIENEYEMRKQGYFFADRTIQATISTKKCGSELEKFIRIPILESSDYKTELLTIATQSFTYDRRFHLEEKSSPEIAESILKKWISELDSSLVCIFKEQPIGFLNLQEVEEGTLSVHLAAVLEQYRITGAAMGLYAKACLLAKERGAKKLIGRISSQNMAVMNIYASFGASFSSPIDVFIKEIK